MKRYKGYLIDLDGTMYRGSERISAAEKFVRELHDKNIPYLFVTNNSSRTPEQVASKLRSFDIPASHEHVFTTSLATANYIYEKNKQASIFLIGEEGIQSALQKKGFVFNSESADYVVIGLDRSITYEKLATACLCVRAGATLISTNEDIAIPTERGLVPGNGSITSVVSVSTQAVPIFIGKPQSIIMEQALLQLGVAKEDTLMIGDNYDTDISAGIRAGIDTLLVHTGVTSKEALMNKATQPTYVVNSLADWAIL